MKAKILESKHSGVQAGEILEVVGIHKNPEGFEIKKDIKGYGDKEPKPTIIYFEPNEVEILNE